MERKFSSELEQLSSASPDYEAEAAHFLRRLLDRCPTTRMTAAEALRHPFLTKEFAEVSLMAHPSQPPPPVVW